MSIKYYQLAKDEALPDEFCAVRDVGGEPSEYVFYVPDAENVKLRELVYDLLNAWDDIQHEVVTGPTFDECERYAYELGIGVD